MKPESSSKVGVHYDECYLRHDTGDGHPESAGRYRVLRDALHGLPDDVVRVAGREATVAELMLAHEAWYHDVVYQDVESLADRLRTGDTAICEHSYEVAREAAGGLLCCVDAVATGKLDAAYCAARPPGHHATATRGMGFCVFNHVAIAARYLQKTYKIGKVAIIDWDVHHGNGTEEIFLDDPSVYYVSLHEDGIYPFTAQAKQRGTGKGEGFNLNLALPSGSGGGTALEVWDDQITPELEKFAPDFVLISAGFDARENDPIGHLNWTDETFAEMTRRSKKLAEKSAKGRIVSVLEGGYNPPGLASASLAHVNALRE